MDERDRTADEAAAQAQADWRDRTAASAENYERSGVPAIFHPWALRLLDQLALAPGTRLLDLACGTGVVARLAAARLGRSGCVVGLDISAGMLAVARAQPAPAEARLHWHVGTAEALPYRPASFDVVACAFGLMFVPDRPRALAEVRLVLEPGGRLAVSVWGTAAENPVDAHLIAVLARYAAAGASTRQAVSHALGDPDVLRRLLTAAGFQDVMLSTRTDEHCTTLAGTLSRVITPRLDEATRAAVRRDVLTALAPYLEGERVRYPVTAHLATARA